MTIIEDYVTLWIKDGTREKFIPWLIGKIEKVTKERDIAWAELREIRAIIKADPEEATSDEVKRLVAEFREKLI